MYHGHYGPLTPSSPLAPSFPHCPCGPRAPRIPGIPGMLFNPGSQKICEQKGVIERNKILIRWKNNNKEQQENSISNDNTGNKLKIFLIFPYFDLSTILIMISFPHALFPVGLCHCTIHDFWFLSFRSLLSFHTLIPGGPPLPCDPSWPLSSFIPIIPGASFLPSDSWFLFSLLIPVILHGILTQSFPSAP